MLVRPANSERHGGRTSVLIHISFEGESMLIEAFSRRFLTADRALELGAAHMESLEGRTLLAVTPVMQGWSTGEYTDNTVVNVPVGDVPDHVSVTIVITPNDNADQNWEGSPPAKMDLLANGKLIFTLHYRASEEFPEGIQAHNGATASHQYGRLYVIFDHTGDLSLTLQPSGMVHDPALGAIDKDSWNWKFDIWTEIPEITR